jgi:hypothetical protein
MVDDMSSVLCMRRRGQGRDETRCVGSVVSRCMCAGCAECVRA